VSRSRGAAVAPVIAKTSSFGSSAGDGRVGMVGTRDVAAIAAQIAASPAVHPDGLNRSMNENLVARDDRCGGVDVRQFLLPESAVLSLMAFRATPPPGHAPDRRAQPSMSVEKVALATVQKT
jgi:hypothetical protein